jgi:hypothetical protein
MRLGSNILMESRTFLKHQVRLCKRSCKIAADRLGNVQRVTSGENAKYQATDLILEFAEVAIRQIDKEKDNILKDKPTESSSRSSSSSESPLAANSPSPFNPSPSPQNSHGHSEDKLGSQATKLSTHSIVQPPEARTSSLSIIALAAGRLSGSDKGAGQFRHAEARVI